MRDRLIRLPKVNPDSLSDFLLIIAFNMEEAMIAGGLAPGKDYTALDAFKLAEPIAREMFLESRGSSKEMFFTIEP